MYKGWNTHAYTDDWKAVIGGVTLFQAATGQKDYLQTLEELEKKYGKLPAFPKFRRLYTPKLGGYMDSKFGNVNVATLLVATWKKVKSLAEPSIYRGFGEILQDIGTTCVQGDSHRLFAYWTGITE